MPQASVHRGPAPGVWDLIADIENHPDWWPRVVEVECEGLDEGCTYRQITQTPFGKDEMNLLIEDRDDPRACTSAASTPGPSSAST